MLVKGTQIRQGILTISECTDDPCISLGLGVQWRVGAVGTHPA